MPTIHGTIPWQQREGVSCIWCGASTDVTFVPEFRPDLGPQPLHLLCCASMIRAYERMRAGQTLDGKTTARLRAISTRRLEQTNQ